LTNAPSFFGSAKIGAIYFPAKYF